MRNCLTPRTPPWVFLSSDSVPRLNSATTILSPSINPHYSSIHYKYPPPFSPPLPFFFTPSTGDKPESRNRWDSEQTASWRCCPTSQNCCENKSSHQPSDCANAQSAESNTPGPWTCCPPPKTRSWRAWAPPAQTPAGPELYDNRSPETCAGRHECPACRRWTVPKSSLTD